jgi:hypothetical protein
MYIVCYTYMYVHTYVCVCVYIYNFLGWLNLQMWCLWRVNCISFHEHPSPTSFPCSLKLLLVCVYVCLCVLLLFSPLFCFLVGWLIFETGITLHPRLASHFWSSCPSAGIIDKSHHPQLSPSFLTTSHKLCLCFWQWVFTCYKWCKYFVQDCHLHFRVVHFFFFLQHQYFGFSNVTFDNPLFWIFSHS